MKKDKSNLSSTEEYKFSDIFDIEEIQRLQDLFSEANEVASVITSPEGTPITRPSNFCRLCNDIIRNSEKGMVNCFSSDAKIGQFNMSGVTVKRCLSAGLWDAGVSIKVGDLHIGNWLIGQVRTNEISEDEIGNYADKIKVNRDEAIKAFREIPIMSEDKFQKIADMLYAFANEISDKAYKNILLKKEVEKREKANLQNIEKEKKLENVNNEIKIISENLPNIIWKADVTLDGKFENTYISEIADKMLELPQGTINNNFEKYFSYVVPEYLENIRKTIAESIADIEKSISITYQIEKENKEIIWVESTGRAYFHNNTIQIFGITIDITDQKETQDKLQESEYLLSQSQKVAKIGSYVLDITTESWVSTSFLDEIFGMDETFEKNTAGWMKNVYSEDRQMVEKHFNNEVLEQHKSFNKEYRIKRPKDGLVIWVHGMGELEFDEAGKPVKMIGTIQNIDDRIQIDNLLRESEERYRSLMENLPVGVFRSTLKGELVSANQEMAEIYGYNSVEELLKVPAKKYYSDLNPRDQMLKELKNKGVLIEYETQEFKKDGSKIWVSSNYKLVGENDEDAEIDGIAIDITERKNAENELIEAKSIAEQNETRFKALHNASFGGIAIHDKGKILDCNYGLSKLSGFSHKELIGMDGLQLIAEELRKTVMDNILAEYEKPYEVLGLRKNGEKYPVRLEGRMIPFKGKRVRVVEFRDITEIKRTENELILAKEKAEESDRLKSAFLANMSHEIRTPMNGILGFTSLLQEPGLTGEQHQSYIDIIQKSGARMLNTVNDIIEISKIETGQIELSLKEVNINEQMKFLYSFFRPEAEAKGIQLNLEKQLPEEEAFVYSDESKFTSILTNLIKNAIKYSNEGSITVNCRRLNEKLEISVTDTGIGIPPVRQKAIFERFVQADIEDTRVHEGSGLGLAITKSYVEMLGGEIWVESQEKEGSTFYFTMDYSPIKQKEKIEKLNTKKKEIIQKNEILLLVVEDDEVSYMLMESILSNEKYKLLWAKNGMEAVELVENNPKISLVLMDLKMPDMDGFEATQKIRKFNRTIPIIAQTAYALEGDKENALKVGCNDYISKPINKQKLLQKIDKLLYEEQS